MQSIRRGACALIAICLSVFTSEIVIAAPLLKPTLVTPELLADVTAIKPGRPFTVGVKLQVASGWHVYWINPGDSGQPIEVEWNLPEGFTASPLQYPLPERIKDPGGLISFGYLHEVMLTSTITPPTDAAKIAAPAKIVGNVTWLVCRNECIPGKATLSLELPIKSTVESVYSTDFEKWRAAVPREPVDGDPVVTTKVTMPPEPEKGGKLTVRFNVKSDLITTTEGVEWFPPPTESIQYEKPQFELKKGQLVMTVDYKVYEGQQAEGGPRESVLAYRTADGVRRGIAIPLVFRPEK